MKFKFSQVLIALLSVAFAVSFGVAQEPETVLEAERRPDV